VNIDTVRFSHILEANELVGLNYFLSHTAFVVSHKSESIETLLGVLWYLPVNSPIIVVTNSPEESLENIKVGLKEHLTHHAKTYLVHQKDASIATFFREYGVDQILGKDGRVVDGKGEGMYIGTMCALLLGYPQWIIFYDADNFVPSALLEYTLAMSRLFMSAPTTYSGADALVVGGQIDGGAFPDLHNVRICWSSKPELGSKDVHEKLLGRCTRVVSPLFSTLLEDRFGIRNYAIYSSNAGEQGMTMKTAKALRFSSGFSVETFQLLDFLCKAAESGSHAGSAILQQYQSKSPHFHDKKGDNHIKKMIAESLGSFFLFERFLSRKVRRQLQQVYKNLNLELMYPVVYPSLQDIPILGSEAFVDQYKLFKDEDSQDMSFAGEEVPCASL
jgi:mannosyl-3-phosphoglycerate synthase